MLVEGREVCDCAVCGEIARLENGKEWCGECSVDDGTDEGPSGEMSWEMRDVMATLWAGEWASRMRP